MICINGPGLKVHYTVSAPNDCVVTYGQHLLLPINNMLLIENALLSNATSGNLFNKADIVYVE